MYFPYPVQNNGLFKFRTKVIEDCKQRYINTSNVFFQSKLPNAQEIHKYYNLISHNTHSTNYLGQLLTDKDPWKFVGSMADIDNIYKALNNIIQTNEKKSYIMTNTGGHHADNAHYELFCPLNQLFFIIEYLNYHHGFPEIAWIDVDAHFGNGDKKLLDGYKEKMKSETNNVTGLSIHNDGTNIHNDNYIGINYERNTNNTEFLQILTSALSINQSTRYALVFFGTDIVMGDYGANENISPEIIPQIVALLESKIPPQATTIYIQTGGADPQNIMKLIETLTSI
jgi:acetoin utilization deacetylase AcuC-like enzyme